MNSMCSDPVRLRMKGLSVLGLLIGISALATGAEPAWKAMLTPAVMGPHPRLVPTAIEMKLGWKNTVDAGKLRIEFGVPKTGKSGVMVIKSSASSHGAAAAFFPYRSNYWCELHSGSLRPRFFQSSEWDGEESVTTTVRYLPDRVEVDESTSVLKTGATTKEDHVFRFAPTFDLFSAMLHVRSQSLTKGERVVLVMQPFKTPYLLEVESHGSEMHEGRKAIRLSLKMRKIDRGTLELKPYKKLKAAVTLWLTDDADRVPLEIRAPVFIGDVRATLVRTDRL